MSKKSYFVIQRRVWKRQLLDLIEQNPEMPLRKIKGIFSLKTGLTFRRIDMYLAELEASGLIEFDSETERWKMVT